jgi:tetratricopeptide (TPR) repeat protein
MRASFVALILSVTLVAELAMRPTPAGAQTRDELLAKASAAGTLRPHEALEASETLLARDSLDAEANWRAAIALVDLGNQIPDRQKSRVRDSMFLVAERYARRAVRLAPGDANTHFALVGALGKAAITRRAKQRVKDAAEVLAEARQALALDPNHDGAHHALGRWHAEVERLSNLEEFFAKQLFGATILDQASWTEAVAHLERAVALRPDYIYHRLVLAEVYMDLKRYAGAHAQLSTIPDLPTLDAMDPVYRKEAAALLARIADRR